MHLITINSDPYPLPKRWNDLTEPQFRAIVELVAASPGYDEARLRLFLTFTGLRVLQKPLKEADKWILVNQKSKIKNQKSKYVLATFQLIELSSRLSWIFSPSPLSRGEGSGERSFSVSCRLTRNLLPVLKVPRVPKVLPKIKLYGPSNALSNLRFSEYIYLETNHARYMDTVSGNAGGHYLDAMIAIIYRPRRPFIRTSSPTWDGDFRIPFNPFHIEKNQKRIARLSTVTKHMILMWYQSCTLSLRHRFPEVFTNPLSQPSPKSPKSQSNTEIFNTFMAMVNTLSADDVTKKDAVRESYLYDALETINEMVRCNKELEKRLKQK